MMKEVDASEARYGYLLQLNAARGSGDVAAARLAELALQALCPELVGLDLWSCSGWTEGAKALLSQSPPGTALVDEACDGLVVLVQGQVVGLPRLTRAGGCYLTEGGLPLLGREAGPEHWDYERSCWEAHEPMHARDVLLFPHRTTVRFVEVA
ncbi:hypothetical protein [Paracidovorax oryzae]|uniref:hypothetical protein n=2 Tax=Paracidovorax oryzae TaxID=862720 RepID=UPI0005664464|nr:hypothetical protein [Paracidovorax oryzae]